MIPKADCTRAIRSFRTKGIDASDEQLIATVHLMNSHGLDNDAALDASSRSGNDHGIDAWHFDPSQQELYVYQSKLSESRGLVLKGLRDLERALEWLESVIVDGRVPTVPSNNHALHNLYVVLSRVSSDVLTIHFRLISPFDPNEVEDSEEYATLERVLAKSALNSLISQRQGRLKLDASLYNLDKKIPPPPRQYTVSRLMDSRLDLRPGAHLDLAYVSLFGLVELYRQRGEILFDKNVRLSLTKTKDARDRMVHPMKQTLDGITKGSLPPNIFTFYHVGITLAAAAVEGNLQLMSVESPSVVNGCQTIHVAAEYLADLERKDDRQGIEKFRQIKVVAKIVVGTSNDELREITNSNNRQNPIENWQLFSNEPIHIEIESILKEAGVFYERQKGKFEAVMKNTANAKFYHATGGTYVRLAELGQVAAIALGRVQWGAKPSDIFLNRGNHDVIFSARVPKNPKDIVFLANLLKAMKRGLNSYIRERDVHANSPAREVFAKTVLRANVYRLVILHFYQAAARQSTRDQFSQRLVKKAHPELVEQTQSFYQKIVTPTKEWYLKTSNQLEVDVSSKAMETFFKRLATENRLDLDGGARPFRD